MKKILMLAVALMVTSLPALADYEFGSFKVSKLRFGGSGLALALSPAPTGCGGGNQYRMHLRVDNSNPSSYKDMVAGLISAHATGQKLEVLWYDGKGTCSNSHLLTLTMFEFAAK